MILVTGASGFVGRALCAELKRRGAAYRVAGRDTVGSIDGATDWSSALDGVDTVIHLAAKVHVMDRAQAQNDATFWPTNVDGSLNLGQQAAGAGVRRLVYLSSIKVNGETTTGRAPFTADEPPAPLDAYGRSKLAAEQGLLSIDGIETVVIRPPLVYGPGVKANFRSMMGWVRRGIPLPLGAVQNSRSLVYVGNLVDLLIHAGAHSGAAGEVFLASDGDDVSTTELLRRLAGAMERPSRLIPVPAGLLRGGAAAVGKRGVADRLLGSLQVDIAKTREQLAWTPPFTMAEGLRATVAD